VKRKQKAMKNESQQSETKATKVKRKQKAMKNESQQSETKANIRERTHLPSGPPFCASRNTLTAPATWPRLVSRAARLAQASVKSKCAATARQ
jgi:hypothetical protein